MPMMSQRLPPIGSDEFTRIKQLINVATDILNIIYERTKGTREARYVADFAQASINYWQPDFK